MDIPIIDFNHWESELGKAELASKINYACREHGFFYVSGHGIGADLQSDLLEKSRAFFQFPEDEKMKISMARGGRAWRGYFPVNGELTSGRPDKKEGLYFGSEDSDEHPNVKARIPLHGKNIFPEYPKGLDETILAYIDAVAKLGQQIMKGIALSLDLEEDYFFKHYTTDPLLLFRIFHYPPQPSGSGEWGVGEHTDYGLLTILLQDNVGGLQVKSNGSWVEAPPIPGTFICNIGDMLDKLTGGIYRSTPHRVLNVSDRDRFSFPLFFDPGFDTKVVPIVKISGKETVNDTKQRWDSANIHIFKGTYGDYLLGKIGNVFPDLGKQVL